MDRQAAREILPILIRIAQEAADTIDIVRRYALDGEPTAYVDAIGQVVAAIDDAVRPIVLEHKDLDPGGFLPD